MTYQGMEPTSQFKRSFISKNRNFWVESLLSSTSWIDYIPDFYCQLKLHGWATTQWPHCYHNQLLYGWAALCTHWLWLGQLCSQVTLWWCLCCLGDSRPNSKESILKNQTDYRIFLIKAKLLYYKCCQFIFSNIHTLA